MQVAILASVTIAITTTIAITITIAIVTMIIFDLFVFAVRSQVNDMIYYQKKDGRFTFEDFKSVLRFK